MIKLKKSLAAWRSPIFEKEFKNEMRSINTDLLPLQAGLSQTSYVQSGKIDAVVLNVTESENHLRVRASIFYSGVIAGSCCSDDPTPVADQPEHCEMEFVINKITAETKISIIES